VTGLRGHPSFSFHPKIPSYPPLPHPPPSSPQRRTKAQGASQPSPASPGSVPVLVPPNTPSQFRPAEQEQCSHCSPTRSPSLFSAWPGLWSARTCTGTCLAQLAHTLSHCTALLLLGTAGTAAAAATSLLGAPSIHPFQSFVSCPLSSSLSISFPSSPSSPKSPFSPSFSTRPIPHRRRGASAEPFTSTSSALPRLPVATGTSRSFENFSTRRPQHNLVTCRQGIFGP
ncbi:hypothetical protein GQ607_003584, partial [Colletotrichum asianum]